MRNTFSTDIRQMPNTRSGRSKARIGRAHTACACATPTAAFSPDEAYEITKKSDRRFPDTITAIHCHNDGGLAVASTSKRSRRAQDRYRALFSGSASAAAIPTCPTTICNLQLKRGYECIPEEHLPDIYESAMAIAETANAAVPANEPYIGMNAFRAQGGHACGRACSNILPLRAHRPRTHREQAQVPAFGDLRKRARSTTN